MAKRMRTPTSEPPPAVTEERAVRLCRLIQLLGPGSQTRSVLLQRLKLDLRAFYRDLEFLRKVGVLVELHEGRYVLQGSAVAALHRVPFPDPRLTLGEVLQLSKGRTTAHRKLKQLLEKIQPS